MSRSLVGGPGSDGKVPGPEARARHDPAWDATAGVCGAQASPRPCPPAQAHSPPPLLLPAWSSAPPSGPGREAGNQRVCPPAASLPCGSPAGVSSRDHLPGEDIGVVRGHFLGGLWRGPQALGCPGRQGVSCPRLGWQAGACLLAWEAEASTNSSPGASGGWAGSGWLLLPGLPRRLHPGASLGLGRGSPQWAPCEPGTLLPGIQSPWPGPGLLLGPAARPGCRPGDPRLAVPWVRPGLGDGWAP